jgi:FkbM family methyltransferase
VSDQPVTAPLASVLSLDPLECRRLLDDRYSVLDQVLAGDLPAIVYPAARMGRAAAGRLLMCGARIIAFGDAGPAVAGTLIDCLPVLSPQQIAREHRDTPILVASTLHDSAIREELGRLGCTAVVPVAYLNLQLPDVFVARELAGAFAAVADAANREAIRQACSLFADAESRRVFAGKLAYYLTQDKQHLDEIRTTRPIYFDESVFALGAQEVVVDGGAYTGDTLKAFLQACGGRFRAYYAFEPDRTNYCALELLADGDRSRIQTVAAGLSDHTGELRFLTTSTVDARVLGPDEPGGEPLPVVGLDDFFAGRPAPTLIKMDIEGAESDALAGAAQLLGRHAPALAVSAYHRPADLWQVPLLIHRLNPGYRLFLRHYSRELDDTVCYALADNGAHAVRAADSPPAIRDEGAPPAAGQGSGR